MSDEEEKNASSENKDKSVPSVVQKATATTTTNTWGTNGKVTAVNPSNSMTLRSQNSMDSVHIMGNSTFTIAENFIPQNSTSGLILVSYSGILNGTPTTAKFLSGETLSGLKTRISTGD